jgi:hypothetical protein
VPGHLAFWLAEAPGEALDFAQVGGIEGEDAIRFPQLGLFYNYGFGFIGSGFGHFWPFLFLIISIY